MKTWNWISILHFRDRNSKPISKTQKSAPQNLNFDFDFEFLAGNLIFKISQLFSPVSLESHHETPKVEFSDIENPEIFIFASKF